MSSVLSSQGVVLAIAMAVSGTIILLVFRRQNSQYPIPKQVLRPCLSSSGDEEEKKREKKKSKKKKKVHFTKDVVEPREDGEELRSQQNSSNGSGTIIINSCKSSPQNSKKMVGGRVKEREMPANRVALYNGILRERMLQRLAHSY